MLRRFLSAWLRWRLARAEARLHAAGAELSCFLSADQRAKSLLLEERLHRRYQRALYRYTYLKRRLHAAPPELPPMTVIDGDQKRAA